MSRGRSVSRKRSIRGKSNHGAILRQPCRYYLKGTCTRSPCEYWHPPECQFYKTETGCKAGDKCLFPHQTVDEQQNKKPKKELLPKKRESDDKNAVAIVKSVSQVGSVSQDSDALVSQGRQSRGNPMQKVLKPFKGYDSQILRDVTRVSGKRKDHRWEKQMSQFFISEIHTVWNLRTGPLKRLKDSNDASVAWNLAQNIYKLKEKDEATFYSPAEEWVLSAASTKEPEEREFVVDSWASMHMVSEKDLDSAELETMRTSRRPTTVMANGEVQTREEATVCVKELDLFVTVMLLEETTAVLSLGKLCEDHGYTYHCTSGQKPHLTKNGKRIDCNISSYVPFGVPGCEFLHNAHTYFSIIFITGFCIWRWQIHRKSTTRKKWEARVCSCGETRCINQQKPKTKITNEGGEEVRSDIFHELPDWLQALWENLVDESTPLEPRGNPAPQDRDTSSSSHELPMESRAKVERGLGKHGVYTHFPKDPNCDICLKTKITRASCKRRANAVVPRAEHFGDLITADHHLLIEGSESRNNHRFAVVIQDLATQWLQSYSCKTKNSQET